MKKTPLKKSTSTLKRSPFKVSKSTLKAKTKTVEEKAANKAAIEQQWDMFLSIWNTRPHKCVICGKYLGNEPLSVFFDHILEKAKYKHLKYEPANIALVCMEDHANKTNGNINEKYKELINNVKQIFKI